MHFMAYTPAYRVVRKALRHTRNGRDQKVVSKLKTGEGKPGGRFGHKSFKPFKKLNVKRDVTKKGVTPKRQNHRRSTPFKKFVGGSKHRTTLS